MRMYLKAEYRAAINLFRKGGSKEAVAAIDAINAYNADISRKVYNSIKEGFGAYQTTAHGARMIIIHQSSRRPDAIQISHFNKINGTWIAFSHGEATTPEELKKHLMPGRYVNLRRV